MNIITQESYKRQAVIKPANKKGKGYASRKYGVSKRVSVHIGTLRKKNK